MSYEKDFCVSVCVISPKQSLKKEWLGLDL